MGFWGNGKELERIAKSLERLVQLYELDLHSRRITTYTGSEEGEFLLTDEQLIAQKELEDALRTHFGLAPNHDFRISGNPVPASQEEAWKAEKELAAAGGSLFGASWGLGLGPEGAESPEPVPGPEWSAELGPPGGVPRQGDLPESQGQSGADSGAESQRGPEEHSGAAGEKAGE